ncbi:hypothetical protein M3B46_14685 [Sphingobacterium daejeonense]|uniref:hypothetical protein n=1 Tax=Sphingobacterium daejeonense TaxID=371142 RepID=UPI0021A8F7B5|nr:hypothetical protein [Sphingobacterium daejeonense]MCT1532246.1 hypothetical protein [Sphingobacterium daejeonense]
MLLKKFFGYFSVKSIPFLEYSFLRGFQTENIYCSYIELEQITGVGGTILLSVYSSNTKDEKLFGDIICYQFSKNGMDKFIVDFTEVVCIERQDLPSFKYISDSGTAFYLSEGRYLLMYANKVKDHNSIVHLNYFFIHSAIHIRFKIVLEYYKRENGMFWEDREKLYGIMSEIMSQDKIIKLFSKEKKSELIEDYLRIESTTPPFKDIPEKDREKVPNQ